MKAIKINDVEWITIAYIVRFNVDMEEGKVYIELSTKNTYEYFIIDGGVSLSGIPISKLNRYNVIYSTAITKIITELEKD